MNVARIPRRRTRRQPNRRRVARRVASAARPLRGTTAPSTISVRLKYTDQYTIGAVAISSRTFAFNDLYDPNVSGVGAQPAGFDQWSAFYSRFYVSSCDVVLTFVNVTAVNPVEVVLYPSQNGTILTTTLDAAAQPYAKHAITSGSVSSSCITLRGRFSSPLTVGRILSDTTYTGSSAASPSVKLYANIIIGSLDGLTAMTGCVYRITMNFNVKFFSPNQLALS